MKIRIKTVCLSSGSIYPAISPYPPRNIMLVTSDFGYNIHYENKLYDIVVPKGFDFNGASIPRFFWRIIGHPYMPDFQRGALLHDFIYRSPGHIDIKRKLADRLFMEILREDGVSKIKSLTMYNAVRTFGKFSWK